MGVEKIWAFVTGTEPGRVTSAVLVVGAFLYRRYMHMMRKDALAALAQDGNGQDPGADEVFPERRDAEKVRSALDPKRFGEGYRQRLRELLSRSFDWLPRTAPQDDHHALRSDLSRAFSNGSLDFFLLLAILYPIAAVALEYALAQGTGALGDLVLFDPEAGVARRLLTLGSLAFLFWASRFANSERTLQRMPPFRRQAAKLALFLFAFAFAFAGTVAGAFAGAFAVAVAFAGVFAFAGAFAFAVAGAFAGAFAVAVAVAGACAVALMRQHRWGRKVAYPLLLAALVAGGVLVARFGDGGVEGRALLFFLLVLPISNAAFDWLSFGVTRFFLWQSLKIGFDQRWQGAVFTLVVTLLDFAAALLLLIGLGMAMVSLAALLNLAFSFNPVADGSAPFIDVADKLALIRGEGGDRPQWLYAVHLSTFVPSLVHLILAVLTLAPPLMGRRLAQKVRIELDQYTDTKRAIALWLTLRLVIVGLAVVYGFLAVIRGGVTDGLSRFGEFVLAPITWWAELLGQLPG